MFTRVVRFLTGPPESKIDYTIKPPRVYEVDEEFTGFDTPPPERSEPEEPAGRPAENHGESEQNVWGDAAEHRQRDASIEQRIPEVEADAVRGAAESIAEAVPETIAVGAIESLAEGHTSDSALVPRQDAPEDVADTPTPVFQYRPLTSEQHFRVLTIAPSADMEAPIVCSLQEHDIGPEHRPSYTAISYLWGTDEPSYDIRIVDEGTADEGDDGDTAAERADDGVADDVAALDTTTVDGPASNNTEAEMRHDGTDTNSTPAADTYESIRRAKRASREMNFKVRSNLWNLLRHLRSPKLSGQFWIDALCIDQGSFTERNQQVRLMGEIYSRANRAVAWLESGDNESLRENVGRAFDFMSAVERIGGNDRVSTYCMRDVQEASSDRRIYGSKPWRLEWTDLSEFCNLAYWGRKWIIQEVILVPSLELQVGHKSISITAMQTFFGDFRGNPYRGKSLFDSPKNKSDDPVLTKEQEKVFDDRYWWWAARYGKDHDLSQTSSARIALHRLASREGVSAPQFLHQLLPRYQQNKCSVASDHVYALYNLVGEHRADLEVDYSRNAIDRFQHILTFAHTADGMPSADSVSFTALLMRLLRMGTDGMLTHTIWPAAYITATAFDLGEAQPAEETTASKELRENLDPLKLAPKFQLESADSKWTISSKLRRTGNVSREQSPSDFAHFNITNRNLYGMASNRVERRDRVWLFTGTPLVLIVRVQDETHVEVVGRAQLYTKETNHQKSPQYKLEEGILPWKMTEESARHLSIPMDALVMLAAWVGKLL